MFSSRYKTTGGFTLAELLVAIAVLSLLVVIIAQLVSSAAKVTTFNNSHMDANDQSRAVFDRMANDFGRMLKRPDADVIFCKAGTAGVGSGANDVIFFLSESAGLLDMTTSSVSAKNNVSLVGYRIDTTANDTDYGQIERLGKALTWDTSSVSTGNQPLSAVFLSYPAPGSSPLGTPYSSAHFASTLTGSFSTSLGTLGKFSDGVDTDYHVLGRQVFRFEYSFLLKDGTQSAIPVISSTPATATNPNGVASFNSTSGIPGASNGSPTYAAGSRWYDTGNQVGYICTDPSPGVAVWKEIGVQDISAIVVTIATLDTAARVFARKAGIDMETKIAPQLPDWQGTGTDATGTPITSTANDPASSLVASWNFQITPSVGAAKSPLSTATGLPQSIASRIRVYQRFFYLNTL